MLKTDTNEVNIYFNETAKGKVSNQPGTCRLKPNE